MHKNKRLKKPLQFEKTHTTLIKSLGEQEAAYDLACHICHENTQTPLKQTLHTLLDAGIHIHQLLSSISACEQQWLQYAFDSAKTLPPDIQFTSAKKIIHHFNQIQDTLLTVADLHFEHVSVQKAHDISQHQSDTGNRSIASQEMASQSYQSVIQNTIKVWQRNKSIAIRNYHQGLTIRSVATFLEYNQPYITIQWNEDVARIFAIHASEKDAFAVCEGEKVQVRLHIEQLKPGRAILSLGKIFPVYAESRKHLNIQVDEHIPVTLRAGKKRQLHARLHDLSIGGLGINVHGINQAPYHIGDKIECRLSLGTTPVSLHGIVRWTGNSQDDARIGIELMHHAGSQQLLQKEVFRMQRNIISSINQLVLPEQFQEALK